MNKIAALLPIKAHSERVKGKNFRLLCGKPLYQWVLETLLQVQKIDRVVVDTDSEELIAQLKKRYPSVQTILRPEEIRGDLVSMNSVIANDIAVCSEFEFFFQTHTTNPLLSLETINCAIDTYFSHQDTNDSLFSVNRIQARTYWGNGQPINHVLGELKRTQDLCPIYEENSNFFIFSRNSFTKTLSRLGERPYLFETLPMESLEIDEEQDFQFVEVVMESYLRKKSMEA